MSTAGQAVIGEIKGFFKSFEKSLGGYAWTCELFFVRIQAFRILIEMVGEDYEGLEANNMPITAQQSHHPTIHLL